jgi:hypothetical protein
MDLFRKDLIRGLIAVDFAYPLLVSFQNIYALDDFARVLLEQKDEKLVLVLLKHVDQFLAFSAIELSREAGVGDSVDHDFEVRLFLERVLAVDWHDFGVCAQLLAASLSLLVAAWLSCEDVVLAAVFIERRALVSVDCFDSV